MSLEGTVINVRYGSSAAGEKSRLLRHSLRAVTRRAWAKEKERVKSGTNATALGRWTPREIRQIQVQFGLKTVLLQGS